MNIDLDYTLDTYISEKELKLKISELASKISEDYQGKELLMVGVLKGSVLFLTDLIRQIPYSVEMSFISVSSYGSGVSSSGSVRLLCDLDEPLLNRDVLIVEDIIDSGNTLKYLYEMLILRKPNSLRICTLLNKPARRKVEMNVDYVGFNISDQFVVGYGLDYASKYRNLPYIATLNFKNGA